jgi:catechol 2,3-dioxygenase-like lactoylglutathione lyase family enzyme
MKTIVAFLLMTLSVFGLSSAASAGEANLTRFGPKVYDRERGAPIRDSASFRALHGPGELVVEHDDIRNARITLNGVQVFGPPQLRGDGTTVVPVNLERDNTIEVNLGGKPDGRLGVRVRQFTRTDLNVRALVYFGINTSSLVNQRVFYNTLGLTGEIYPAGPEQCRSFAQSLGFPDNYLIFVSLTSFTGAPPWVDTVQFRGASFRDDPPYANLNHLGMAYATYATSRLDADYAYLKGQGITFVSAPATAPNGERFAFLKDPDGTFLKLVEAPGTSAVSSGTTNLSRLANVNINVADLERSREFYRLLGFSQLQTNAQAGDGTFARAHGFDRPIAFREANVSLPGGTAPVGDPQGTLQLRQWSSPFDARPPYAPPVNHLGIDRVSFFVNDLNAAVAEMNRLGFTQLGPIGGGAGGVGSIAIAFFFDPDGVNVELWGFLSAPNPNSAC